MGGCAKIKQIFFTISHLKQITLNSGIRLFLNNLGIIFSVFINEFLSEVKIFFVTRSFPPWKPDGTEDYLRYVKTQVFLKQRHNHIAMNICTIVLCPLG